MPSFTSSSDSGGMMKSLVTGLLLTVAVLGIIETNWRHQGHLSSVIDDKDLWALNRGKVYGGGEKTVALLGASRMELDLSEETLNRLLPGFEIVQLAIDGTHPLASLRDLAGDDGFDGIALCSIVAPGFERRNWDYQEPYVQYYRNDFSLNDMMNRQISTFFQNNLVLMSPRLKFKQVLERYVETGQKPSVYYLTMSPDRYIAVDYSKMNIEKYRANRIERLKSYYSKNEPLPPEEWLDQALSVDLWVEALQQRGGRVVFLRLPTSGEHWRLDEEFYPKKMYWDRFSEKTAAETLHFKETQSLGAFDLPDTSHIDASDRARFTEALIGELSRMGVFQP